MRKLFEGASGKNIVKGFMAVTAALGCFSVCEVVREVGNYASDVANAQLAEAYTHQTAAQLGIPANYRYDRDGIIYDGLTAIGMGGLLVYERRTLRLYGSEEAPPEDAE
jgi:hypothetical protein